jgi:acyl-CoA thioesterase
VDVPPPLEARPAYPPELAAEAAELDALFRSTPMYETLGIDLEAWGPGWARLSMRPTAELGNLAGSLHGGATFALADAAFEVACNAHGRLSVALETTCHYHRPTPLDGELRADAWEVSRGGRTATYRLQVADAGGRVLTSYLALAFRTDRWHLDAARFPGGWG